MDGNGSRIPKVRAMADRQKCRISAEECLTVCVVCNRVAMRWPGEFSVLSDEDYLPSPWCRVLLEKLTGLQLVKKFPAF